MIYKKDNNNNLFGDTMFQFEKSLEECRENSIAKCHNCGKEYKPINNVIFCPKCEEE